MICGNDKTERMLARAFSGYIKIRLAIDVLNKAGLAVEGGSMAGKPGHEDMSVLYGALTDLSDQVQDIFGIPKGTKYSEEADMVLGNAPAGGDCRMDAKTRQSLMDIADTARKAAMLPMAPGDAMHEVTVSMAGGISVLASDTKDAMEKVSTMAGDEVLEQACWDGASATDAYRT